MCSVPVDLIHVFDLVIVGGVVGIVLVGIVVLSVCLCHLFQGVYACGLVWLFVVVGVVVVSEGLV